MSNKELVQAILEKSNGGLDIFQNLYNDQLIVNGQRCKNVKSLLYKDGNASLSIYEYNGKWRFKDYGKLQNEPEHKGDVFTFVKLLYGLNNFGEACEKIIKVLKLDINMSAPSSIITPQKIVEYNTNGNKSFKLYQRYTNNLKDVEQAYFNQYGITVSTCFDFNIIPVDGFEASREDGTLYKVLRKKDELMFAYIINAGKAAKIYRPNPKMFSWLGDKPSDYVGGLHLLPETPSEDEFVIITAGEKDAASLYAHGYNAITFNSETASISDQILSTLRYRFENRILVAYDIDETGKKASNFLCEKHDLKRLMLPQILLDANHGKDISDYFKVCHDKTLAEQFKEMISLEKLDDLISKALSRQSEIKEFDSLEDNTTEVSKGDENVPSNEETDVVNSTVPSNQADSKSPFIPEEIYDNLPDLLKSACNVFDESREKDLILLGAITVLSGIIENVFGEYDNTKCYPNLYLFVSAPASAGKGALKWTKYLGDGVHSILKEESKTARLEYEKALENYNLTKDENPRSEKPQEPLNKKLFVPANSSASSFLKSLSENDGKAIMFETEADTLRYTLEKDFGNYSDSLRKIWHNESISLSRRTDKEEIEVNNPRLSLLLSGTPQQLYSLIPDAENGLFSRFCFYSFDMDINFKNVFLKKETTNNVYFTNLGKVVLEYYLKLKNSEEIEFQLTEDQQEYFLKTFETWHAEFYKLLGVNSLATIRRLGLIEFRIAMILTTLRACQKKELPNSLVCNDDDFDAALKISEVLKKHAMSIYRSICKGSKIDNLNEPMELLYKALPENFNRVKAMEVASSLNIKEKSTEYYLKRFIEKGLVQRIEFNKYIKLNN
jgi:hypothetical protein